MCDDDSQYNVYSISNIDIQELMHEALHGDCECLCALGYCYENGIEVEQDEVKAFDLYKQACDQGFANGIYNTGIFYGWGKGGVKKSARLYFEHIKKAAELGFAPAQNDLGWCYEDGINHNCIDYVDKDEAFKWYLKSAKQGHHTGIYNVIRCYREGVGIPIDEEKAQEWEALY